MSEQPVKLEKAIVRRGTVVVGEWGKHEHVGPGGEVELPAEDVARLRAAGVLHDPDANGLVPVAEGPRVDFNTVDAEEDEKPAARPRRRR